MTAFQRVIKYCAIALAIIIIASIISAAVGMIASILGFLDSGDASEEIVLTEFDIATVNKLDIDLGACDFKIISGDKLTVEADSSRVRIKQSGDTLSIKEKDIRTNNECLVTLTLPEHIFEYVEIDMGAGVLDAEKLSAERFELDLGAGKSDFSQLRVVKNADIDVGVGKLTLSLSGTADDYTLDISKGIGEVTIDGISHGSGKLGNGSADIELDCGVGAVDITFMPRQ